MKTKNGHKLIPKTGAWVLITQIIPTVYPVHRFGIYYAYPTGNYFFKGELNIYNEEDMRYEDHPYTGENYSYEVGIFGGIENFKIALVNYGRNPHHDFTDIQKKELDSQGSAKLEKLFPIEAQVRLVTEYGSISIQPHEYSIVDDEKLREYFDNVDSGNATIIYLSNSKQLKGKIAEQVFYCQSKGIGYSEAIKMCIGQVKTSNLLYLYMHPGYVKYFTREPEFKRYVTGHIVYMKQKGLTEQADDYLGQIRSIEGYKHFKLNLKKQPNDETNTTMQGN